MTDETKTTPEVSLHDWLAIGEIDLALSNADRNPKEEICRLPLFLRLLSASQPLAAIPVLLPTKHTKQEINPSDPLLNSVVSRLEDVAASYSEAEGIDVLTTCHAPNMSRRLSKIPPLKRKQGEWLTLELNTVGGVQKKRRLSNEVLYNTASESDDETDEAIVNDADSQNNRLEMAQVVAAAGNSMLANLLSHKITKSRRKSDAAMLQEDSQESLVAKTLQELTALVVEALKAPLLDEDGNPAPLKIKADSILAEADASNVGPTLAALMYHLPVLRHEHVANAICRANLPQASVFLLRLGQNFPAGVPAMIRGCLDAQKESPGTVKTCLRSLAGLSKREAHRVRSALQHSNILVDLQLEIGLDHDTVGAACLLNRELDEICDYEDHVGVVQDVPVRRSSNCFRRMSATGRRLSGNAGRRLSSSGSVGGPSKTFGDVLKENPGLTTKAYETLLNEIQVGGQGRRILFLRALTWLLYRVGGTFNHDKVANVLEEIGSDHGCFSLQLTACVLLCARAVAAEGMNDSVRTSCQRVFFNTFRSDPWKSLQNAVFASQMATLMHSHDIKDLLSLLLKTMRGKEVGKNATSHEIEVALSKVCAWTVSKVDLVKLVENGLTEEAILTDSSALMCAMAHQWVETLEHTTKSILSCPDKCQRLLAQCSVYQWIQEISSVIFKSGAIPCILPVALESLSRTVDLCARPLCPLHAQFLLQFAYCLCVAENNPLSPFSIDARDFPAKEVLRLCKETMGLRGLDGLERFFKSTFSRLSPEILVDDGFEALDSGALDGTVSLEKMACMVTGAIKKCAEDSTFDPSGMEAEKMFLWGKRRFSSIDVDKIAVKALLSTTTSPALYLSYPMLIRDPLVLLRCPILVWTKRGLRRIMLVILQRLLSANDHLVTQTSQSEEVAGELLASRDTVIVRCLLVLTSGKEGSLKAFHCSYITSTIRSILAKTPGLVTMLIKQGHLSDLAVDFLIDFVPETMNDADALVSLLSERSPLTAAERLRVADVALRIAIVHGSRNEVEAKNLAHAALNQLTSSFFLVVGPVGVPVNVLIEESGNDVTRLCRRAANRMLEALQKVRGDRAGFRNECANKLQKLAGMCKGENMMNGVGGLAAQSRKKVLKQIWESITKACNTMASGVQI